MFLYRCHSGQSPSPASFSAIGEILRNRSALRNCRTREAAIERATPVLEVGDSGIGISGVDIPHIFDRFYRTDKARSRQMGGSGLGLSIARSICLAHDGHGSVESTEGEGSVFRVEIPIANGS